MMYSIFQLKDNLEATQKLFLSYDYTIEKYGAINFNEYDTVYTGEIHDGEPNAILEEIYTIFNTNHPAGFRGHSLSKSDLVALEGIGTYFCDSFGWKKIN